MSRSPANFRQSDVVRAINAARRCHLEVVRTEIGPDGSIVLVHPQGNNPTSVVNELDAWRAWKNARSA
jgi:hypothetical protein